MNIASYKVTLSAASAKQLTYVFERLLFTALAVSLLASVFAYRAHWMPLLFSPVEHIQLRGEFISIDRLEVEQLVRGSLGNHFFDTDLKALRRSLESMAWVKRAHVTREWPSSLSIDIEEHAAAARWGKDALLSSEGAVFSPTEFSGRRLPMLYASPGMEALALDRYHRAREQTDTGGDVSLVSLVEDRYGMWRLRFSNGLLVTVDDTHWESRLARFAAAWREGLYRHAHRIRCVDLRYTNGFAVAWRETTQACR